jgi:hypothetical protein
MNDIERAIETLKDIYPSPKQIITGEYPHVADSIDLAISALEKQQKIKECLEWLKTLNENEKLIVGELIEIMESFIKEVENE